MAALLEGRRFQVDDFNVVHWDARFGNSPIRNGASTWNWRGFKHLHEIVEFTWKDEVSEDKPMLCWINKEHTVAEHITEYATDCPAPFRNKGRTFFYATPVKPSECYKPE